MYRLILILMFIALPVAAEMPPIEDIMSEEEMSITGLDKLSAEELQVLREWLEVFVERDARHVMKSYREEQKAAEKAAKKAEKGGTAVAQAEPVAPRKTQNRFDTLNVHIDGEFSGWRGKTRFKLSNGQVWEQRKPDAVRYTKPVMNPAVVITENFLGKYIMSIPSLKLKIPVRRVQ